MARPKGLPKTGGRQKGTPNKNSVARILDAAQSGMLPHEFLLKVMRGERIPVDGDPEGLVPTFEQRIEAAKAAAPYYAPKLATVAHTGPGDGPVTVRWEQEVTNLDRAKALAAIMADAGEAGQRVPS